MNLHRTRTAARSLANVLVAGFTFAAFGACSDTTNPTPLAPSSLRIIHEGAPVDLTPDGSTALLEDRYTGSGTLWTFNTNTGALTQKGAVGDIVYNVTTAMSATGRVTALYGMPVAAGLYTDGSGWQELPSMFSAGCNQDIGGAHDISADGHVVVGLMWDGCSPVAFRWSDASGTGTFLPMQVLGTPADGSTSGPANRASVISDDGLISAGFAQVNWHDRWPAIWRTDGTGFLLPVDDALSSGEFLAISADGSALAGIFDHVPFYWTASSGVVSMGLCASELPGDPAWPLGIALGGQLIIGTCGADYSMTPPFAFVWTPTSGMRSLEEVAVAAGVTIPSGYHLVAASSISTDGTVVLGRVADTQGREASYVLRLPVSAYGL